MFLPRSVGAIALSNQTAHDEKRDVTFGGGSGPGDVEMYDDVAAEFETHRPKMKAVARRLLASDADTDDAVQEAWCGFSAPTRIDRQP